MYETYDDETLELINSNVNLIEYVGQQLELEKRGDEYFAHCPKHTDKTPSLSFTPKTNKYYCFSCGRGGGIINYIHQYEGLPFSEAVQKAAKLANTDLNCMCKSKTIKFLKNLRKQTTASKKKAEPHAILSYTEYDAYKKAPVEEWLSEGIKQDVMDLFDIRIDVAGNRIVYPVYDSDGNLINIKGRTRYLNYKKMGIPKYINYKKVGCMDYFQGMNITLPYIKERGEVIIFESLKSVMKAYGWGYKNCISAEKHTLTNEQLMLLIKMRVNIVFAFDSDIGYGDKDVAKSISKLKRLTNVYIINDKYNWLGGKEAKNAPVDLGRAIWERLYDSKRRVS